MKFWQAFIGTIFQLQFEFLRMEFIFFQNCFSVSYIVLVFFSFFTPSVIHNIKVAREMEEYFEPKVIYLGYWM